MWLGGGILTCGLPYLLYDWFFSVLLGFTNSYRATPKMMGTWEFWRKDTVLLFLALAVWVWEFPG